MFANDLSKTISQDEEVILDLDHKFYTIENNDFNFQQRTENSLIDFD